MGYERLNLKTGQVITEAVFAHLEDGIEGAANAVLMTPILYADLVSLRDAGQLKAGMFYRITDYVTTTTQENTQSAGHPFDIIVLAISENELSEDAYAKFASFNIERYKDAYSMTYDSVMNYKEVYEHNGNQYHLFESADKTMQMLVDLSNYEMESFEPYDTYPYFHEPKYIRYIEDGVVGEWIDGGDGESISFKASINVNFFKSHRVNLSAWKIRYCLDNDAERFVWADAENGKGVIYRMIDEWDNDCPYDFKNILFRRYADRAGSAKIESDAQFKVVQYVYTFTWSDIKGNVTDASIYANNGSLTDDSDTSPGVHNNVIKKNSQTLTEGKTCFLLPNIIFFNAYDFLEENNFYGCFGNEVGANCEKMTFNTFCCNNTVFTGCSRLDFVPECQHAVVFNGRAGVQVEEDAFLHS